MKAHDVIVKIYSRILEGKAPLPSLPEIVPKVRSAIKDPACDVDKLCQIIQCDPPTAAYLLRVANSPIYRTMVPATNIKGAVRRLGMQASSNLVTSHAVRQLFSSKSHALHLKLASNWKQSTKLAAISSVLASRCFGFDPDRALLAGLLQDIGAIPLLVELDTLKFIQHEQIVSKMLALHTSTVGILLLKQWNFDADFIETVRSREDWQRNPRPQADLADIVLIARLHSYVGTPQMKQCPRINEVPAFSKLPLGELTPELSIRMLIEAREDIAETQKLIGG